MWNKYGINNKGKSVRLKGKLKLLIIIIINLEIKTERRFWRGKNKWTETLGGKTKKN